MQRQMDASFDWDDFKALRDAWPHELLVKGIMDPADAVRCVELGANGIVLSNHGGRQLEDAPSPIEILPAVAAVSNVPLLLDSGVRRGSDAVKAVALGAQAVLLGRPLLYGLAVAGEEGVSHVISMLAAEVDTTLALLGCPAAGNLNREFVRPNARKDASYPKGGCP
ncbi:MAG: alpha-hydroxy-acid oxidizing protein [Rhodopila sp.]|jgi:(S)-mandelate dehydrogenase